MPRWHHLQMARLCVTNRQVIVDLSTFERVGSLYLGDAPRAPLAAVIRVELVAHPSSDLVDDMVKVPFLLGGQPTRPRSTIPRVRTYEGGWASVVTWSRTSAVRVDFDSRLSPWAFFLISDPDADRLVRRIRAASPTGA